MLVALANNQTVVVVAGGAPGPTHGLPVTETWNVANAANTLTGDHPWVSIIGTNQWGIVSHAAQLENAGGSTQASYMNWNLDQSDYQVAITLAEFTHPGTGVLAGGLCARMQGTTAFTFYALSILAVTGTITLELFKFLAGVQTSLGSVSFTPTLGMRLTWRGVGNAQTALVDGTTKFSVIDPDIPTGQFFGLQGFSSSAGNRVRFTNLAASVVGHARRRHFFGMAPLTGAH